MNLDVSSADGSEHDVQIYTDISAEWVSGDHSANAQWSYGTISESATPKLWGPASSASWPASQEAKTYGTKTAYAVETSVAHPFQPVHGQGQGHRPTHFHASHPPHPTHTPSIPKNTDTGGIAYHQVYRQQQLNFSETNQQADWGYWYYATENTAALSHQSGADVDVRGQFLDNGYLANTEDTSYRGIDDDYPVFGFAVNLGEVGSSTSSTLFQLSLHQDYCVQFEGASGNQTIPCLWTSYFDSDTAAVRLSVRNGIGSLTDDHSSSSTSTTITALAARSPQRSTPRSRAIRKLRVVKTT